MQQAAVRKMGAVLRSDNFVVCAKIVVRAIVVQKSVDMKAYRVARELVRFDVGPVVTAFLLADEASASSRRREQSLWAVRNRNEFFASHAMQTNEISIHISYTQRPSF
jgi:hypothetical protein